jgi:hypothetical protein
MMQRWPVVLGIILSFSLLFVLSAPGLAVSTAVIDFEGIPEGTIVSTLTKDFGISGDPIPGFVTVHGLNPDFGPQVNAAMIFDARCLPGGTPASCSGNDGDLFHPEWGNTLIISEDLNGDDPDDGDVPGSEFLFDFRNWGGGSVTVESIGVHDVEEEEHEAEDARIYLFTDGLDGNLIASVDIPHTGNGNWTTVFANVDNVGTMRVDLEGSGMINNVRISTEPTAVELVSFTAEEVDDRSVAVVWKTSSEIDNYGFNLYRSTESDLDTADNIHFEPAGTGSGGHTYAYTDTPPGLGSWWYWLADVDTNGVETFHGPIVVEVDGDSPESVTGQIFMPITIYHLPE